MGVSISGFLIPVNPVLCNALNGIIVALICFIVLSQFLGVPGQGGLASVELIPMNNDRITNYASRWDDRDLFQ